MAHNPAGQRGSRSFFFPGTSWHFTLLVILGTVAGSPYLRAQNPFASDSTIRIDSLRTDSLGGRFNLPTFFPDSSRRPGTSRLDSLFRQRGIFSDSLRRILRDSLRAAGDTLGLGADTTTARADTSWVVYLDSTARIEEFVHVRHDAPVVDLFPRDNYSLYCDIRSPAYRREVTLDSLGEFVTAREMVNGVDVKVANSMPLDDYIHARLEAERQNSWRSIATEYKLKDTKDQLSGFLSQLTNIEIPVPSNPLFSIFGGKGIKLNVSGAVDIHGAFRNTKSDQVTISTFDQTRNEPDFKQDVQIGVNGTIGDKLSILADWNTQRTFDFENQLKVKYTGYDDEIVQSVEAGNVSLQTPSLVGGGQALFGIKARLQTGPLTLTTLLSQKKGQAKELTVSGGAQSDTRTIYPHEYAQNYYFIDTVYRRFWETLHSGPTPQITSEIADNQVIQIDVWQTLLGDVTNQAFIQADAVIDLPYHAVGTPYPQGLLDTIYNQPPVPGSHVKGKWIRLDPKKDYKIDDHGGFFSGYITLNNMSPSYSYAVTYTVVGPIVGGRHEGRVYGDSLGGKVVLKLIRPADLSLHPDWKTAWSLMLKNIYELGGRDLKREGFEFRIYRRADGISDGFQINNENILTVLYLDRFNQSNVAPPDGEFDFITGLTVDPDRAAIIFPTLRPFDSTIVQFFARTGRSTGDSLLFSDIYDTTAQAAENNSVKNRYYMKVKSSTAQTNQYHLGFNLVEGSVQVLLNGIALLANVDYTVDYILGEVVIRNPQALVPGANVQVKYEQNDLFQLASKTLVGARGELTNILPNTNMGFTFMNLNQATLSDKVRVGEEPTNNFIMGADASTGFDLPFLTAAIDALPFLKTREMSSIRFGGEVAYMMPDPNTKKSTILGDNAVSIAYLDDFEGARRTIPIPINYGGWHTASPPAILPGAPGNMREDEKTWMKAKTIWYNRLPSDVLSTDIWPNKTVPRGQELVTVMNLDFDPRHRGVYNYSPNLDSTLHREGTAFDGTAPDGRRLRKNNWGGITRYLSNAAGILDQNIGYLEIWMNSSSLAGDEDDLRRGRLYVDLGRISEDVIPNGQLNSEDLIHTPLNPGGIRNGSLQPGEDVGLDTLSDAQERDDPRIREFMQENRDNPDIDPNDPSGDDWAFSVGGTDFTRINGTEGNGGDANGRLPDTEDMNDNGIVDLDNQYVEYEIPLDSLFIDSSSVLPQRNRLIVGGGSKKWYQFRIPLTGATRVINSQNEASVLGNIQYVRLWVSGFQNPVSIRIADMSLVGNQWQERYKNDSTMKVSAVSIEDNPDYTSPPGVIRERDRTQPDQVIEGNEQSLALLLNGLVRGDSRQAFRSFGERPLNLFNYRVMKMFVHGDPKFAYYAPDRYDAEVFIRFGSDSLNFYEYRQPVRPGWDPLNDMNINFQELTSVKTTRDSLTVVHSEPVRDGPPGATYAVRGNPALTQIREIAIGVTNPAAQGGTIPLVGQIWVNELRLVDVDNSKGVAYRFDTQMKLADLGAVAFNYSKTDPNFHGLEARFGSQVTTSAWGMNSSIALDKFFGAEWQGTSIPIGYSHAENLINPKYLPNSDIVVSEAAARASAIQTDPRKASAAADAVITSSQTLHVQDSYSVPNLRIVLPIQAWYIRDTFSKLTYGFNYNTSHDRDPSIAERQTWLWSLKVSYGATILSDLSVQPFKGIFKGIPLLSDFSDWKLYYFPVTNFQASFGGQRSRTYEVARTLGSIPRDTRAFTGGKSFGFGWKLSEGGLMNFSGDYGLSLDRNLQRADNDTAGRGFGAILKTLLTGGEDGRYGQRVTINSKPKILNILNLSKYLDLGAGYGVNYAWQNSFQSNDLGKSTGFDNTINLSMAFRLKALTDPWFQFGGDAPSESQPAQPPPPKGGKDSTGAGTGKPGKNNLDNVITGLKTMARVLIKYPLLDYETINITFTEGNRAANSGVIGGTGFKNFWGRLPFFQGSVPENGPSNLYQLGLISDPGGRLKWTGRFPFFFERDAAHPGLRAPGGSLSDMYSQTNNLTLHTNRPLWEGATLDINWKVGWQYSKTTTITTDALGNPTPNIITSGGSVERSYLTLPPFLFLKVLNSNLEAVGKKYDQLMSAEKPPPAQAALAESFEKGLEALPFLSKIFGEFVPRPNWGVRWDGIEKLGGLRSVVDHLSLEHSYQSSFRRDFRGDITGGERTDVERVTYGFTPVAGINATFKEFLKGNLTANLRYNSNTTLDLNLAAQNIVETQAQEMSLSIGYSRRGFRFPLFGLSLSNDIDLTTTFSRTKNARRAHDPRTLSISQDGIPLEGSTRTLLEPRIRYTLSSHVSASLYYRFQKTSPDEGGSLVFGNTTNEAGVDIHITIQ